MDSVGGTNRGKRTPVALDIPFTPHVLTVATFDDGIIEHDKWRKDDVTTLVQIWGESERTTERFGWKGGLRPDKLCRTVDTQRLFSWYTRSFPSGKIPYSVVPKEVW